MSTSAPQSDANGQTQKAAEILLDSGFTDLHHFHVDAHRAWHVELEESVLLFHDVLEMRHLVWSDFAAFLAGQGVRRVRPESCQGKCRKESACRLTGRRCCLSHLSSPVSYSKLALFRPLHGRPFPNLPDKAQPFPDPSRRHQLSSSARLSGPSLSPSVSRRLADAVARMRIGGRWLRHPRVSVSGPFLDFRPGVPGAFSGAHPSSSWRSLFAPLFCRQTSPIFANRSMTPVANTAKVAAQKRLSIADRAAGLRSPIE